MSTSNARQLRKNSTDAEGALWKYLRAYQLGGHKFRRQQPIGPYIVDFVCFEKKLIIEVDGDQHAQPGEAEYDEARTELLKFQGFQVLRFWNNQVLQEIEAVKLVILKALETSNFPEPD